MAGLHYGITWQAGILMFSEKSMSICQIKLIMYVSPLPCQPSKFWVCFLQSCACAKMLKSSPVPRRLTLCPSHHAPLTLRVHAPISIMAMMDYWHLTNMTGCHRSLSRDFQTVFPLELTIIEIVY